MPHEAIHNAHPAAQSPAAHATGLLQPELMREADNRLSGQAEQVIQPKLMVGAPDDPAEHEADAVADRVVQTTTPSFIQKKCAHCEEEEKIHRQPLSAAPEAAHITQQRDAQPIIQRDGEQSPGPRGGVSVHSPVVDEFLVQVSDVHSSVSGRPLLRSEADIARTIFGNSVDYTRVRLLLGNLAAGTTAGNNIRLPADFSIANAEHQQLLIHEMTHVWQFQHNGAGYITTSLLQQLHAGASRGNRNFAYDYHISEGNRFFEFAPEQQAFIVENYFAMLRDQRTLATPAGATQSYRSNHLDATGFNAVLTAAQRTAEINAELPLHEPLIRQMSSTPFLSAASLMQVRQRDVLIMPPQGALPPAGRGDEFLPTPNLFEIRWGR